MEGHERDYANEITELSQALENEQTTKESLEDTFALELSRLKESHDRALEVANDFRTKNDNSANLISTNTSGLLRYTSKPADLKTKYSNFYGNYQECTQSFLNINNSRMSYISSNGTYLALVNGIYVPLADKPTYNSETQTCSDVNLASSNKFSAANGPSISYGKSIYFDNQYLNCWRLNYA